MADNKIFIHDDFENELWTFFNNVRQKTAGFSDMIKFVKEKRKALIKKMFLEIAKPKDFDDWSEEAKKGYKQAFEDMKNFIDKQ